ncbi:MAG TPA: hypothetical protein VGR97_01020 [Candidatus Acidoferrales bacterium]|nr:hypothetical protein [Candidatus Acidoferrales bacterium]
MKTARNILICVAAILLSVPLAYGQDLSKYRNFSLGTSLIAISRQVNERPAEASVIHQSPALIQELTWWPMPSYQSSTPVDPVQQILFSFYNGALYKMVVTYDSSTTEGVTAEDMTRAISAKYGAVTIPIVSVGSLGNTAYGATQAPIAQWEDLQYSVILSRTSFLNSFQLVICTKQLNDQAEAASIAAAKQEREDAPQMEIARVKKAADDLETARQNNLKSFRP